MKFWALGTSYLTPLDPSAPGNMTGVPVNVPLYVFHWGLCCADTGNRAVLRGGIIEGGTPENLKHITTSSLSL